MNPLFGRIVSEKRRVVIPLGAILLLNLLAYFIVVRPLAAQSAGASDRAAAATAARTAAERDVAAARALVAGKARAEEELAAFYSKVLPADVTAARRMTYAMLPALAKKSNVRYEARTTTLADMDSDSRLGQMTIRMMLGGDYESVRRFIYEVESAPEFVILDDVVIAESAEDEPLSLSLNLSTYFRLPGHGS